MANNSMHMMGTFNDHLDEIRSSLYRLLDFEESDWSEKKNLAKREVLTAINELRIKAENL